MVCPRKLSRPWKTVVLSIFLYVCARVILISLEMPTPHSSTRNLQQLELQPLTLNNTKSMLPSENLQSNQSQCESGLLGVPTYLKFAHGCHECTKTTCREILFGNPSDPIYEKLRNFMKSHPYKPTDILSGSIDCKEFVKRRGYHTSPVDTEEADFPIAFNILMHTSSDQTERLLRTIYRPQNVYCIHIDAKASANIHKSMAALMQCFDNVFIATKLERITYAGFSRLQADINCMQDMLKVAVPWKYLINTAAQAFPLKSNAELVKALKIYNGSNDIEGIYGAKIHRSRFETEWKEVDVDTNHPKMVKTENRNPPPPDEIDIVRGSAYGVFSRDFVRYIITDQRAKNLLEWSRNTYSPDEHYWATLHHTHSNPHMNPPGGFSGIPDEKPWLAVYAAWGGVDTCGGVWKHGACVFGISDLPLLMKRREHFANKFYVDNQPLALDCLEAWIEHKVQCPPEFDYKYYQQLTFIPKSGS